MTNSKLCRVTVYVLVLTLGLLASLGLMAQGSLAQGQESGAAGSTWREKIKQRLNVARETKAKADVGPDSVQRIDRAGDYRFTVLHGGVRRQYRVHVPQSYRAQVATPVLLSFHGGGGNMDYQADDARYGQISKSESAGFIAIFPNGHSRLKSGQFATWNAGACCAGARDQAVDDIGFVEKIIDRTGRQFNIDRQQIFASGMSNGGMLTYRLACEMADTFKAIAAVAGTDNTLSCSPGAAISVLHIHARDDDRVLFYGGAGKKFRDESMVADFTSVPDTVSRWVKLNQCQPDTQRVLAVPGAYCDRYSSCQDGAQVQLCVTDVGGHSWPGGSKSRGDSAPSSALSANDVMWAFFQSTRKASSQP